MWLNFFDRIHQIESTRPTFCSYPCSTWRYLHITSEWHTNGNRIRSKLFWPLDVTELNLLKSMWLISSIGFIRLSQHVLHFVLIHVQLEGTYTQRMNHTQPTIGFDPNFSDRWMSPNWTYWKACGWISSIGFIRLSQHVLLSILIHVQLEGTYTQRLSNSILLLETYTSITDLYTIWFNRYFYCGCSGIFFWLIQGVYLTV